MVGFFIGLFVGGIIGYFFCALLTMAKRYEEVEDETQNGYTETSEETENGSD